MNADIEKPHDHRFLAQIEADLVLVNRDLLQIETVLEKLSNNFYRSLGRDSADKINSEYQSYQQKKQGLLSEKKILEEELKTFTNQKIL